MEEHLLTEHSAFPYNYPEALSAWSAYHEQSVHQTGELSYAVSHHVPVNVDQGSSSNSYQQVRRYRRYYSTPKV
jgi:hypothetical protein